MVRIQLTSSWLVAASPELSRLYLLNKAGFRVALLERGRIAARDSGHTTAHLTYVTDQRMHALVNDFGRDHARAVWDAGNNAIDEIERIVRDENIECEFSRVPGYLHAPVSEDKRMSDQP